MMTALHLFAGAGGSCLAGEMMGVTSAGCVEWDEWRARVLVARGEKMVGTDIALFDAKPFRGVDMVFGGSPCQDFSTANWRGRDGLQGGKSSLFVDYVRVLRETRAPFFLWENVRGVTSANGGKDFAAIFEAFKNAGYSTRWCVWDGAQVGTPMARPRVFVFGFRTEAMPEINVPQPWEWPAQPFSPQKQGEVPRLLPQAPPRNSAYIDALIDAWCPQQAHGALHFLVTGTQPSFGKKFTHVWAAQRGAGMLVTAARRAGIGLQAQVRGIEGNATGFLNAAWHAQIMGWLPLRNDAALPAVE